MKRKRIIRNNPIMEKTEDKYIHVSNINPSAKTVFGFIDGVLKAQWDSLTLCGNALGLSRNLIKKHIESGVPLESGYVLKLTNK